MTSPIVPSTTALVPKAPTSPKQLAIGASVAVAIASGVAWSVSGGSDPTAALNTFFAGLGLVGVLYTVLRQSADSTEQSRMAAEAVVTQDRIAKAAVARARFLAHLHLWQEASRHLEAAHQMMNNVAGSGSGGAEAVKRTSVRYTAADENVRQLRTALLDAAIEMTGRPDLAQYVAFPAPAQDSNSMSAPR